MSNAKRDENRVPTLLAVSFADSETPVAIEANPTNKALFVEAIPADYELAGNTLHVKKYYTNAGAVTDGIIWSPAAGKRWYVTD